MSEVPKNWSKGRDVSESEVSSEFDKKDVRPARPETLNEYYTRKQRGTQNKLATDDDVYLWDGDRDLDRAASESDVLHRDGFINYKGPKS